MCSAAVFQRLRSGDALLSGILLDALQTGVFPLCVRRSRGQMTCPAPTRLIRQIHDPGKKCDRPVVHFCKFLWVGQV